MDQIQLALPAYLGVGKEKDAMMSCCPDGSRVLAYCPLGRVLTYTNLIYLLNLQFHLIPSVLKFKYTSNAYLKEIAL